MKGISLEANNYSIKDILHIMATCKVTPPERIHWGKMLVSPKKGESFLSWLMHQAWKFRITLGKLIQSEKNYWLQKECISLSFSKGWKWALTLDVLPIPSPWENVLKKRGLNVDISELQVDISKWFDLSKENNIGSYKLKKYYHYNLRYCPICWKDVKKRYFKVLWRLPFIIVCPEHGVELKESCSSCGELLFFDNMYSDSLETTLKNFNEEWLLKCRHCNRSFLGKMEEKPELAIIQNKILNILQSDPYWATQRGYLIFWHTYMNVVKKRQQESDEKRLILMEEILEKPVLIPYPNFYSQKLLSEVERRLKAVTSYLSGTSIKYLVKEFGLTASAIRKFSRDLLERKPIDEIIKRRFGYNCEFGLELAQAEMKAFKAMYSRLPFADHKSFRGIKGAIDRSEWASYGIETWNDLLKKIFGELNIEKGMYIGKQGLNKAMNELQNFKIGHNRLPKIKDEEMRRIQRTIGCREWFPYGIKTWNDLLTKTFGEVNLEQRKYIGKQGLNRAMAELRDFKIKNHRLPRSVDKGMKGIIESINRNAWISYGLETWNDLLTKTFGEVNLEQRKYIGKQGLNRAMAELRDFKIKNHRLPRSGDKGMGVITSAIARGRWASYGIVTWNDILKKTFREVNVDKGIYIGEQGLKQATTELWNFKIEYNRLPTSKENVMRGIIGAIYRNEWVSYGIETWNDLLMKTFGEVNKKGSTTWQPRTKSSNG